MTGLNPPDVPPTYTTHNVQNASSAMPPAYAFPPSFQIGAVRTTRPLVAPNQLKGHLALLRGFWALRESVEGSDQVKVDERIPEWALNLDKEARWIWFVGLAVER
jgi:hypothetical protein